MNLRKRLLEYATRAGVDQRLLDAVNSPNYEDLDVDKRIREYELSEADANGFVLLPAVEGGNDAMFLYAVLAHAFETRGYKPLLIECYKDLDLCIRKQPQRVGGDSLATCALCKQQGTSILSKFGVKPIKIADALPDSYSHPDLPDETGSVTYRGVDVGQFAKSSACKFLRTGEIDYRDDHQRSVYDRMLRSALVLVDTSFEIFESHDIKAVLGHHPAYLYGGIFLDVAMKYDTPSYSFNPGYDDGTLMFGNYANRASIHTFTDQVLLNRVLEQPLTESELAAVEAKMADRKAGSGVRIDYAPDDASSLERGDDTTLVAMFTNLIWDASLESVDVVFSDPRKWITTTIETLRHAEDTTLVIKTHPAEDIIGTNDSIYAWLQREYDTTPPNVRLLPPDTDVSPYDLFADIDAGIVYNSTVGLEMAFEGIPVVVAGDTHYRSQGFTVDPSNTREYVDTLSELERLEMTDEQQIQAYRYFNFFFEAKQIEFPLYENRDESFGLRLDAVSHEDIAPGNEHFDTIVKKSVAGEPIVTTDSKLVTGSNREGPQA